MIIRTLALAGGLAGAAGLSQFPEFSQQYLQRLAGAVDELRPIVVTFDSTAETAGLSRDAALAQVGGNAVSDDLRNTMAGSINRYERLDADLAALRGADPLARLAQPWRFRDTQLVRSTLDDYRPAVPVTLTGLICAAIGFAAGWLVIGLGVGAARRLFGRRRAA